MFYYKVKMTDGVFVGVDYSTIQEGIAFERHALAGYGYIATNVEYPNHEEITEDEFIDERRG